MRYSTLYCRNLKPFEIIIFFFQKFQSPASTVVQTSCSISVTSVTTCTTADTTAIQSALDTAAAAVVTLDVFIASVQAEISGNEFTILNIN